MKITVKFACPEILGDLKSGTYELPKGSSVRELLLLCEKDCGLEVKEDHLKYMLVLVNGRQCAWESIIEEGSNVSFLRGAMGG